MTTGPHKAGSSREDELVSRLYQQVTEQQAARFATGYDMAAGLARYRAWLGEYTARQQASPQEIPPAVPAELPPAPSPGRRRVAWLAPVTAAVAVVALAITLVAVRDMPQVRPAPVASPVVPATGIPRYYLTFDQPVGDTTKPVGMMLGATLTGKTLFTLQPPRGLSFTGITGAADDRTFVADADQVPFAVAGSQARSRTWYLLRVTGTGTRVRLTMTTLPVPATPASTCVEGIALSPDGTKLAVATEPCSTRPKVAEVLRVYSVATGKALRSWSSGRYPVIESMGGGGDARTTLAWLGNHALAYQGRVQTGPHDYTYGVMVLELSHPDGDILASSRLAVPLVHVPVVSAVPSRTAPAHPPFSCGYFSAPIVISGDGNSFVCGGSGASTAKMPDASTAKMPRLWCPRDKPAWNTVAFAGYSLTTGKLAGYLSGYRTGCPVVAAVPLWANNTGSLVIGTMGSGIITPQFGVFIDGTFRPLPIPTLMPGNTWWQGGFLMNRVAW